MTWSKTKMTTIQKNDYHLFLKHIPGEAKSLSSDLLLQGIEEYCRLTGETELRVSRTPEGRPVFSRRPDLDLSLTHAKNLFALAVGRGKIGVDAELWEEDRPRIRERYFLEEEKNEPFSMIWTGKEAVGKLTGSGLSDALRCHVFKDGATLDGKTYALFRHRAGEYLITVAREAEE